MGRKNARWMKPVSDGPGGRVTPLLRPPSRVPSAEREECCRSSPWGSPWSGHAATATGIRARDFRNPTIEPEPLNFRTNSRRPTGQVQRIGTAALSSATRPARDRLASVPEVRRGARDNRPALHAPCPRSTAESLRRSRRLTDPAVRARRRCRRRGSGCLRCTAFHRTRWVSFRCDLDCLGS